MKCRTCGRGITFVRVARDAAWMVFRSVHRESQTEEFDLVYCGRCFYDERHEALPDDTYIILLGEDQATQRDCLVDMKVVG